MYCSSSNTLYIVRLVGVGKVMCDRNRMQEMEHFNVLLQIHQLPYVTCDCLSMGCRHETNCVLHNIWKELRYRILEKSDKRFCH